MGDHGRRLAGLVAVGCLLGLAGCGGGGGDGGGSQAQGYTFTAENTEEAASVAAGTVEFFPSVGAVILDVVGRVREAGAPGGRVAARAEEVDAGDLCVGGSAGLVWEDNDDSGDLSTGDAATLTFESCVLADDAGEGGAVNGTLTLAFTQVQLGVDPEVAEADVDMDVSVEEDVDGTPETSMYSGSFRVRISADVAGGTLSAAFGGTDRADVVTRAEAGTPQVKLGCFDVAIEGPLDTDDGSEDWLTVALRGVADVEGRILQFGRYGEGADTPLRFEEDVLVSGTLTLLGYDQRPEAGLDPCTAVGSSADVQGDGSWMRLVALGGGTIRIERYAEPGAQEPVETREIAWDDL